MSADGRRIGRRRAALATVLVLALAVAGGAGGTVAAAAPRASLTQIENDVMCVICHESLALSQSPQAMQEREYIRSLIAQGKTRRQIEDDLVQQYGPAVLALPTAQGFNLLVYVVPPVLLGLGLLTLALTIPRWRRRARAAAAAGAASPAATLDPADARRLDDDLGRFA
jgi:cytochrome c-type biogenesis protein CcmH